jgi:hypothetical protein
LLQSPTRCYDEPAACGLAPQIVTVLHEYALDPWAPRAGLATWLNDFATNRHE